MHPWLAQVRHDLVKRAVWPARDLRDSGERDPALLRRGLLALSDDEGAPITARALWARLSASAPPGADCAAFSAALAAAEGGLALLWPAPLAPVLALEDAFEALARSVDSPPRR